MIIPPPRGKLPSHVEIEQAAAAMHRNGSVTIPTAIVLAALSTASALGVAWLTGEHGASGATAKDCREAREGVAQLQADARSRDEHARKFEQDVTTTLSMLLIRTDKLR